MRVVLIGCVDEPWFPAFEMKAALEAMGHECRYAPVAEGIPSIARALATAPALAITLQGRRLFRQWTPDYVAECRDRDITTALWCVDPVASDWFVRLARAHDVVFHSIGGMVDTLRERGVRQCYWMPLAYHDALFQRVGSPRGDLEPFRSEIAFVGALDADRVEVTERLLSEGFGLRCWGPPLPITLKTLCSPATRRVRATCTGRLVYGPDFARVAAAADVLVGFDGHAGLERSWGSALYWALGCGAAYLCRAVPGLDAVFKPARHLETFRDSGECAEKARLLLDNTRLRMRLSVQGRQEILANHTYRHRFREIERITTETVGLKWR